MQIVVKLAKVVTNCCQMLSQVAQLSHIIVNFFAVCITFLHQNMLNYIHKACNFSKNYRGSLQITMFLRKIANYSKNELYIHN